jgi:putative membrane protein
MIQAVLKRNDKQAYGLIGVSSVVVFLVVLSLGKFKIYNIAPSVSLGFDPHIFAHINGVLNSLVSLLLIAGLIFVKQKKYALHRTTMLAALITSTLFLVSYICHHFLTFDTHYGGTSAIRYFYYPLLITHIILAATVLPFILLTTYRGLTADFKEHKKIARITYPIWLYVSVSGVIVYLLISPYYTAI